MTPEQKAREIIDKKLNQAGWVIQDMKQLNLFVDGLPVGVIAAKKDDAGENITATEDQSSRCANNTFKWIKSDYRIRFAYEATRTSP